VGVPVVDASPGIDDEEATAVLDDDEAAAISVISASFASFASSAFSDPYLNGPLPPNF
jgi:hypothetical protein